MAETTTALAKPPARPAPEPFAAFRRNFDRFFDDFGLTAPWSALRPAPHLDVTDTDGVIEVSAELPGIEEKDVNVTLEDDTLVISGEKKAESERKEKNFVCSERSYGYFMRRVPLPAGVDAGSVKAEMSKGVLTVKVAKPASAKTTKIEVKPAA